MIPSSGAAPVLAAERQVEPGSCFKFKFRSYHRQLENHLLINPQVVPSLKWCKAQLSTSDIALALHCPYAGSG
jgi:hypothetical protein